jgi:hypothetical protein
MCRFFCKISPDDAATLASLAEAGIDTGKAIKGVANAGASAASGAASNASGATALAKGVIDNVAAISGMVGNQKAREQQQKNFDTQIQMARDKFANDKSVYLADAISAQQQRNKDNWKERITDYRQQQNDAEQRKKMFAFVNAIRGIY